MVLLQKYYIKESTSNWIVAERSDDHISDFTVDEIEQLFKPYWSMLKTIPNYVGFEYDFPSEDVLRYTFKFDVPDDQAKDCFKNYIKTMRDTRKSIVSQFDKCIDAKYSERKLPFPKVFYQTVDSSGATLTFKQVSL